MINIVIPIAGKAQRFIDAGFTAPKPLIMVDDKHMIDWALESFDYKNCRLIFVVRQDHINSFSIDRVLKEKFGDECIVIAVDHITQGTLCTCLLAEDFINNDDPLIIYTPDVCFDAIDFSVNMASLYDGLLLTFKANSPAHSYAQLDGDNFVSMTAEKRVISEHAAVGVYCFKHGSVFVGYAKEMLHNQMMVNGEFYVCPLYNLMINDGFKVKIHEVNKMHVLGTPEDVNFFVKRVLPNFGDKPIALCADHSGYQLKEDVKKILTKLRVRYIDFGTYIETDCDHHDYLSQVVRHINNGICDFGMAFCRTGQGFNIAANKAKGIRSALIIDTFSAEYAIRHNAANFFCLPSRLFDDLKQLSYVLQTLQHHSFDGGRHATRIRRIENDTELFHE